MENEIQIVLASTLEELRAHADLWDELAFQSPQALPMLTATWVIAFLNHCITPLDRWLCLLAYLGGGRLVGVLPLIISPHRRFGLTHPVLRTPWDWHTRSGDVPLEIGAEHKLFARFLDELTTLSINWFSLEMRGVKEGSPTLSLIRNKMQGYVSLQCPDSFGSFLSITGSFENYRGNLSKNFKNNLNKAGRRLCQLAQPRYVFLRGDSANLNELQCFLEIEASGWKGRNGTAILQSEGLTSFYREISTRFLRRGCLELDFLEADGKRIAGHLRVRMGRSVILLKIAYDEEYERYSPGNLLFEKAIQQTFESNEIDEINCLTDTLWHRNWKMSKRCYDILKIFPKTPYSSLMGMLPEAAKLFLRRVPVLTKSQEVLRRLSRDSGEDTSRQYEKAF
ncbi:MAG: GNAT family N-acetyltransferase [Terriglobia bacterium]